MGKNIKGKECGKGIHPRNSRKEAELLSQTLEYTDSRTCKH